MNYALEIDAADVLGVSRDATLQQIHEAYRARAKKHHPDVGGDDWAFRVVSRSYELLSNARLRHRLVDCWPWTDTESESETTSEERDREQKAEPQSPHSPPPPPDHESSWVRAGVEDNVDDPCRLVDVELFTIRYELESALDLLGSPENRNLSSCLTVIWPIKPHHDGEPEIEPDPALLKKLRKAFDSIPRKTKAISSWSNSKTGRFQGWISYPTATQASKAFDHLHRALLDAGLGARQLTREMFLARESR